MKWLSNSSNMKKASLAPSSPPWRNWSSDSKRIFTTPHLYGPVSQLSEVNISLINREDIEVTYHGTPCSFTYVTTDGP